MTTNKPGSVNQRPLYGCTSCFEDYSWPASELRVYDIECWCEACWDERRWEFPDQPDWASLERFTPPLQTECEKLRKDAERYRWWRNGAGSEREGLIKAELERLDRQKMQKTPETCVCCLTMSEESKEAKRRYAASHHENSKNYVPGFTSPGRTKK